MFVEADVISPWMNVPSRGFVKEALSYLCTPVSSSVRLTYTVSPVFAFSISGMFPISYLMIMYWPLRGSNGSTGWVAMTMLLELKCGIDKYVINAPRINNKTTSAMTNRRYSFLGFICRCDQLGILLLSSVFFSIFLFPIRRRLE